MSRKSARKEFYEKSRASQLKTDRLKSASPRATPEIPQNESPMSISPIIAPVAAAPRLLLVCSLGNPAPYQNTLHSAGHHLLHALRKHLSYPIFQPSSKHAKGQIARGQDALLWKSPTLMNVSGPAVVTAWRAFLKDAESSNVDGARERARLVILHDELELDLGKVKVKPPGRSMSGHNGLKSINAMGSAAGGKEGWWRIGVGIGRPESRDKKDVSDYVLREMKPVEMEKVERTVEQVTQELVKLRDG